MQKTSRVTPVVAINKSVTANLVRLQSRGAASRDGHSHRQEIEKLPALMERVSNAARQMRYFGLAGKQFSFDELISSATRAGFVQTGENLRLKEASFQWGAGAADLIFSVSFRDRSRVSILAESQADIFGLILTACSDISTISVEINPTVGDKELGENALLFRDMLLTFPGFDGVPAWTKYPDISAPAAAGLVEMWRDGICVASVFGLTWNWLSSQILAFWGKLRRRS
jgi:hypothetical protein